MILAKELILKNVVYYKHAHVHLTKNNGFVVIGGHNKDSLLSDDQNNGAGKSVLLSSLPNAVHGSAPLATKARNAKKDLLDTGDSEIAVRFINNAGQKVEIIQQPKQWIIKENGKDTKARTIDIQKSKIAEHFPIGPEEFYSYVYLQSQRNLRFQVDTPAERLKFITSVFDLDVYDRMKAYFTKKLGKMKESRTKCEVYESKLLNVNTQLERLRFDAESRENHKKAKKKFKELRERRDSLAKQVSKAEALVERVSSLSKLLSKKEELAQEIGSSKYKRVLKDTQDALDRLRHYQRYDDKLESYEDSTRRIRKKLAEIDYENLPKRKKLMAEYDSLSERRSELSESLKAAQRIASRHEEIVGDMEELVSQIKRLGYKNPKKIDTRSDIEDELSICLTTVKLKKLLDDNEDSVCPTCLQAVDLDSIRKNVKKAEARIEELRSLTKARKLYSQYKELSAKLDELGEPEDVEAMEKEMEKVSSRLSELKEQVRLVDRAADLLADLEHVKSPKKPEFDRPDITEKKAELLIRHCHEFDKVYHMIQSLLESDGRLSSVLASGDFDEESGRISEEHASLKDELKALDSEYTELMAKCSKFDLKMGEYTALMAQKQAIESEIDQFKEELSSFDVVKALEKAYSSKGLKVAKANEIVGLLEANLNRYSNLIFAEPFKFKVYATDGGIHCDVDRGNKKVSDVRLLSGAESDCFRLLFLLAMTLMVSNHRRTNFVVLDEPDSHMDATTRSLFVERYIPFLRDIVPHVFLITPGDPHVFKDYEHWTVVKENGESKLIIR